MANTTTIVNFTIIFTCILLSLVFIVLVGSDKLAIFITVFSIYMIACNTWILFYLIHNKNKLTNNLTYSSLKYMSFFNILICVILIAFNLYFAYKGNRLTSYSPSYSSRRY